MDLEQQQETYSSTLLQAIAAGTMPQVAAVIEGQLAELGGRLRRFQTEASTKAREVAALERALDRLGVDHSLEVVRLEGTALQYNFAAAERQWHVFQSHADQLRRALEVTDYASVRALMWDLGLYVAVDFGESARRRRAASVHVDMDLARLGMECAVEEATPYRAYTVPA
jgi:hypothetical protein